MDVMIYRRRLGSVRKTLDITFNLDDPHYSHIARWAKSKRTKSFLMSDLEQSVCVSFACYHIPSLPSNPLESENLRHALRHSALHSPCSWPASGNLSLQTKRDGKDFIIPLAPPILVTPNNCIDVSSFIRSGENTFSVVQQNDMSDYLFVFHAHYPTPQQLDYVASCRHRREECVKSISDLCKLEPKESLWRRSPSEVRRISTSKQAVLLLSPLCVFDFILTNHPCLLRPCRCRCFGSISICHSH
ncbi:hypothetical protein EV702DRAFT_784613 [Suillus placidus]|uniref:Uncharacterized protein n=1 Tax=Suillus placidus TaxID=48579 RepID=A0A9P7CXJ9_9AGAM|nr:hypothetical protein EV702DRAFT_784613 [Suillus placidus]